MVMTGVSATTSQENLQAHVASIHIDEGFQKTTWFQQRDETWHVLMATFFAFWLRSLEDRGGCEWAIAALDLRLSSRNP